MNLALRDAEFNNVSLSRQEPASALATASTRDVSILGALALGVSEIPSRQSAWRTTWPHVFPSTPSLITIGCPPIYASIEIDRGNPARAVEVLQTTPEYELGSPLPQFEVGGSLYPVYVRGQAYMLLHRGKEAAEEFQKVPGPLWRCGELPASGAGPTSTRSLRYADRRHKKRKGKVRKSFFVLWKSSDPDIPILKRAQTESKLH